MKREFTRVFFRGGRVAHLLNEQSSPNRPDPALCGKAPFMLWEGTGDQNEIEKAARLRTCKICARISGETQ